MRHRTPTARAATALAATALAATGLSVTTAAPAAAHATCSSHNHSVGATGYPEKWALVSRTSSSCTSDVWYKTSPSAWKYYGRITIRF